MKDAWVENRRHVKGYPHGRPLHIPRAVLRSLVRVCKSCGERDERRLVVDHLSRDSLDNTAENLQVLCRAYHRHRTPSGSGYASLVAYDAERYRRPC